MKKLFLLLVAVLFGTLIAQTQTVSFLDREATITNDEIIALGNNNQENGSRSTIVLDFEGLGNDDYINDFYNGGTRSQGFSGTNYGVAFGVAKGLIDADAGGTGNIANEPSPSTVMFFLDENQAYLNVAAGFTTGFSTYYSSNSSTLGSIKVYDGLNGTGNLLNWVSLLPNAHSNNCSGDPNGYYCNWDPVSISFTLTFKLISSSSTPFSFSIFTSSKYPNFLSLASLSSIREAL